MSSLPYLQGYASDQHVYRNAKSIINLHAKEWPSSCNPTDPININFNKLCGKYKTNAYWILLFDNNGNAIATVTIGNYENMYMHLYNLLIAPEYRNQHLTKQLFHLVRKYCNTMTVFGFVEKNNQELQNLYKKFGAKESTLVTPPTNHITMMIDPPKKISSFYTYT